MVNQAEQGETNDSEKENRQPETTSNPEQPQQLSLF
jgi:hypothetical protein